MEVKNGIIIDGVLHEVVNYSNDYDCILCSLNKECDEFERKYKIHLCNIMKCFRFANRGKVAVTLSREEPKSVGEIYRNGVKTDKEE